MLRFTELYLQLDSTTRTDVKVAALEHYFKTAPPEDAVWALWVLTGGRIKRAIPRKQLLDLAIEASGVPEWLVEECLAVVGDTSETIALLLPPGPSPADPASALPLHRIFAERIEPLRRASEAGRRHLMLQTWEMLPTSNERFVFHKLISGTFRVGVSRGLAIRALASTVGIEPAAMEARLMGDWKPSPGFMRAVTAPPRAPEDGQTAGDGPEPSALALDAARPYPFFLAHQLDGDESAVATQLGDVNNFQAEWKWDGIRAQLVRRAAIAPLGAALWSRGEENIGASFPELLAAAGGLPSGIVLDGEVLAWQPIGSGGHDPFGLGGMPLSFAALQRRLQRIRRQPMLFEEVPVVFVVYDLLEAGGQDVRKLPTGARRQLLQELFTIPALSKAATGGLLLLSPVLPAVSWPNLAAERARSRELGVEGLMLKHKQSQYGAGRTKQAALETTRLPHSAPTQSTPPQPSPIDRASFTSLGWWKWKIDPYTLDVVMIHAQRGSGRRASLFTDYTFAVWDDDASNPNRKLVPIAKAYSGLTDEEIDAVDQFVRRHTIGKFGGGFVTVEPIRVFELAFEGLAESTRHRSGLALRFPRIARQRPDKPAGEADTVHTVRALLLASTRREAGSRQ